VTQRMWPGEADDTTPLDAEDLAGLIPSHVAIRSDLNAVERDNILSARLWAFDGRPIASVERLLRIETIDGLHRRMFADVWKWAGKRRVRPTNIGVEPSQIVEELRKALDDATYWHDNGVFDPIEIAVRLHHRLVFIHPYVNGNGRHARFVADLYLHTNGWLALPWRSDESEVADSRSAYIRSLRLADSGDYAELIAYASGSASVE